MGDSKIEWCDKTWSPITGCSPISEGCRNCWAARMAKRLKGRYGYPTDDPFKVTFHPDKLEEPLKWKKPRMIFVCSMGDLFHEDVPQSQINTVLRHAMNTSRHIYLFLTKRPERMKKAFREWCTNGGYIDEEGHPVHFQIPPYFWLGVTAENQEQADKRIPVLLQIPAAVHFVSVEPMLGPVDISPYLPIDTIGGVELETWLDWVICGGESGSGARPMHPDWPRSLRDQCQSANVPFFFKQWGEWAPEDYSFVWPSGAAPKKAFVHIDGTVYDYFYPHNTAEMMKVGKKKAGRLLDNQVWDEMPEV